MSFEKLRLINLPPSARTLSYSSSAQQDLHGESQENVRSPIEVNVALSCVIWNTGVSWDTWRYDSHDMQHSNANLERLRAWHKFSTRFSQISGNLLSMGIETSHEWESFVNLKLLHGWNYCSSSFRQDIISHRKTFNATLWETVTSSCLHQSRLHFLSLWWQSEMPHRSPNHYSKRILLSHSNSIPLLALDSNVIFNKSAVAINGQVYLHVQTVIASMSPWTATARFVWYNCYCNQQANGQFSDRLLSISNCWSLLFAIQLFVCSIFQSGYDIYWSPLIT